MNKKKDNDFSQKLKDKLKELFQFDSSDLRDKGHTPIFFIIACAKT